MKSQRMGWIVALLLSAALPAAAHHSFIAEFDGNHIITLSGTLTRVEWVNPHAWWYLDVKNDAGETEHWSLEGYPPSMLRGLGVTKATAGQPGEVLSVDAFMAKDGTKHLAHIKAIRYPDGRQVTMWVKLNPNQ
jgi:hypothetical protein